MICSSLCSLQELHLLQQLALDLITLSELLLKVQVLLHRHLHLRQHRQHLITVLKPVHLEQGEGGERERLYRCVPAHTAGCVCEVRGQTLISATREEKRLRVTSLSISLLLCLLSAC